MLRTFCQPHAYTFNEQSKMASALTLQTKHLKKNIIKQKNKNNIISLNLTSDSFVNHFDGHFAYLKTLDFSFKLAIDCVMN